MIEIFSSCMVFAVPDDRRDGTSSPLNIRTENKIMNKIQYLYLYVILFSVYVFYKLHPTAVECMRM